MSTDSVRASELDIDAVQDSFIHVPELILADGFGTSSMWRMKVTLRPCFSTLFARIVRFIMIFASKPRILLAGVRLTGDRDD